MPLARRKPRGELLAQRSGTTLARSSSVRRSNATPGPGLTSRQISLPNPNLIADATLIDGRAWCAVQRATKAVVKLQRGRAVLVSEPGPNPANENSAVAVDFQVPGSPL
jgi:hypothetical protein